MYTLNIGLLLCIQNLVDVLSWKRTIRLNLCVKMELSLKTLGTLQNWRNYYSFNFKHNTMKIENIQ